MELILICEEDFSGAKPFRRQFLFHRLRLQRKFVPPVIVPGPAMAVLGKIYIKIYVFVLILKVCVCYYICTIANIYIVLYYCYLFIPLFYIIFPEHGNLVNVIKDKKDFDSFLYANEIKQYRENINVPYKKNIVSIIDYSSNEFSKLSI
jgi:hypothetical protein